MNKENEEVYITEDFDLEDLQILYHSLGCIKLSMNDGIFQKVVKLREKLSKMYDVKKSSVQQ